MVGGLDLSPDIGTLRFILGASRLTEYLTTVPDIKLEKSRTYVEKKPASV